MTGTPPKRMCIPSSTAETSAGTPISPCSTATTIADVTRHLHMLGSEYLDNLTCKEVNTIDGEQWVEIFPRYAVTVTASGTPVSIVRLMVRRDGHFVYEALLGGAKESGDCSHDLHQVNQYLAKMVPSGKHKFCPGLENYEEEFAAVKFDTKQLRRYGFPLKRIDSMTCKVWHSLPSSATMDERTSSSVLCSSCKALRRHLRQLKGRAEARTEEDRAERQKVSSHVPIKFLSPHSQTARRSHARHDREVSTRRLEKHRFMEMLLSQKQSHELASACRTIADSQPDVVTEVIATAPSDHAAIRSAWEADLAKARAEFASDQEKNETGRNSNCWSIITYRVALAVYTRSPAAYEALKSFGILQLPSSRSLKQFTGGHLNKPGQCEDILVDHYEKYKLFQEHQVTAGKKRPLGEGVLIFDEVKVIAKVLWNSRSNEVYGLAMTSKDMVSLQDVFFSSTEDGTQRAEYILQFIWRDMTGPFDIIGPYYTAATSLDAKFTLACVTDALRQFHNFAFKSCALVFDGASTNLSLVKALMGVRGPFGTLESPSADDRHAIQTSVAHPCWPGQQLHFVMCPSHQLKNMVNALYSSRQGSTAKAFQTAAGIPFGWQAISDLYSRECERRQKGLPRDVPGLRKNFVNRDAWTKLNVHPAKIMQQEHVLSELKTYCQQSPVPHDYQNVLAVLKYLQACNCIFERGLLSHHGIYDENSAALASIKEGFNFFATWLDGLTSADPGFSPTVVSQKKFISWQTWDLLRLDCYGFASFCLDFLKRNPGYFIVPVRVSGSAIETIFSQCKHASGGRLSSTNYATSLASISLQRNLHPVHSSGKDYRDATLHCHAPLRRRRSC